MAPSAAIPSTNMEAVFGEGVRRTVVETIIKADRGSNQGRRFRTAVRTVTWDMVGNWISAGILIEILGFWVVNK